MCLFDRNADACAATLHSGAVLDRETAASYTLDVKAADGGTPSLFTTQTVTVSLNDVNDNTPSISSSAAMSVDENSAGGTADRTSTGLNASQTATSYAVSCSITAGHGLCLFDNNAAPGEVNTLSLHDALPISAASYTLDVKAADGGTPSLFTTQTVTVSLNDVNDNTPSISSSAAMSVDENSAGGT